MAQHDDRPPGVVMVVWVLLLVSVSVFVLGLVFGLIAIADAIGHAGGGFPITVTAP